MTLFVQKDTIENKNTTTTTIADADLYLSFLSDKKAKVA